MLLPWAATQAQAPPTPPAPPKFTPVTGTINSKGIVTQTVSNAYTNATTMTVESKTGPTTIQTQVQMLNDGSGRQRVDTSAGTYAWVSAQTTA